MAEGEEVGADREARKLQCAMGIAPPAEAAESVAAVAEAVQIDAYFSIPPPV